MQLCAEQTSPPHVSCGQRSEGRLNCGQPKRASSRSRRNSDVVPRDTGPFRCSNSVIRKCKIRMTVIKFDL
jgi:hypothetical protein